MKSTRRHELQQNVLDAELGKTVEFFRKYGTRILWAVIVLGGVALAVTMYVSKDRRERASIETQGAGLLGPVDYGSTGSKQDNRIGDLRALSDQEKVPRIAAGACVRLGDLYTLRMAEAKTAAERESEGTQATRYYERVLSDFSGQPLAVAQAHLGLAKLAESRRDFPAAAKAYQAAMNQDLGDHPVRTLAEAGKKGLKDLAQPVRMATTAPATQPAATGAAAKPVAAAATSLPAR